MGIRQAIQYTPELAASPFLKQFENLLRDLRAEWGNRERLFESTFYRTLLEGKILTLAVAQDEGMDPVRFRQMVEDGFLFAGEVTDYIFSQGA